jgi:hypothetical protein
MRSPGFPIFRFRLSDVGALLADCGEPEQRSVRAMNRITRSDKGPPPAPDGEEPHFCVGFECIGRELGRVLLVSHRPLIQQSTDDQTVFVVPIYPLDALRIAEDIIAMVRRRVFQWETDSERTETRGANAQQPKPSDPAEKSGHP